MGQTVSEPPSHYLGKYQTFVWNQTEFWWVWVPHDQTVWYHVTLFDSFQNTDTKQKFGWLKRQWSFLLVLWSNAKNYNFTLVFDTNILFTFSLAQKIVSPNKFKWKCQWFAVWESLELQFGSEIQTTKLPQTDIKPCQIVWLAMSYCLVVWCIFVWVKVRQTPSLVMFGENNLRVSQFGEVWF